MFTKSFLIYEVLLCTKSVVFKVCRNVVKIACETSWNARLRASTTVRKSNLSWNFIKSRLLRQNVLLGCHTLVKVSISWIEPSTPSVLMKISEVTCHKMFFPSFYLELSAAFPLFSFQVLHFYFKTFFSWNWIFQADFSIFKFHLSPSQFPSPGNILFSPQLCPGVSHTILTERSSLKFVFPTQRKTFSSD